jgi:hypothetical protein
MRQSVSGNDVFLDAEGFSLVMSKRPSPRSSDIAGSRVKSPLKTPNSLKSSFKNSSKYKLNSDDIVVSSSKLNIAGEFCIVLGGSVQVPVRLARNFNY